MSNLVSQLGKLTLIVAAFALLATPAAAADEFQPPGLESRHCDDSFYPPGVGSPPPGVPFLDLERDCTPRRLPDIAAPRGLVGAAYAFQFESSGEVDPHFSAEGELPDGLGLGADGLLSGVPTRAGHFSFEVFAFGSESRGTVQSVGMDVVAPLTVTLDSATPTGPDTADLAGRVNPGNVPAEAWFEFWSAEEPVPQRTPVRPIAAGLDPVAVNEGIAGLVPTVEYSVRLGAKSELSPDPAYSETRTVQTALPPPVAGKSFNIAPLDGFVGTKCGDEGAFTRLKRPKQVTLDCQIDAHLGALSLTASKGSSGQTQTADFWGGQFGLFQERGDNKQAVLSLAGGLRCERRKTGKRKRGRGQIRLRKRSGGRSLWGSGSGNYKTVGSHGAATVRGTIWLVSDRCNGDTLFKVKRGTVVVEDFSKPAPVVLNAGEQYISDGGIDRLP